MIQERWKFHTENEGENVWLRAVPDFAKMSEFIHKSVATMQSSMMKQEEAWIIAGLPTDTLLRLKEAINAELEKR